MHHIKAHSQLADATADMMRAYALVSARAASLSASRGISLWAQMLAASAGSPWVMQSRMACDPLQGWVAWNRAWLPSSRPQPKAAPPQTPVDPPAADQAFASYRSAGGHAVAQVIVA
jgi:hypothetical protein